MLYDIEVSAAALRCAGIWVDTGKESAPVQLAADDRMLVVAQGDDKTAFDLDGSVGSDEYVALAPLDPSPTAEQLREQGREEVRESVRMALRDAHRNDSAADAVEFVSDVVGWAADEDPELAETSAV